MARMFVLKLPQALEFIPIADVKKAFETLVYGDNYRKNERFLQSSVVYFGNNWIVNQKRIIPRPE